LIPICDRTRARECLALAADASVPGLRVVRELEAIIAWRGRPAIWASTKASS
jgi:putative transposase